MNISTQSSHPPIVLLLGPTATGKTNLAIDFAKQIPSEIISVDSALVYRGMDIGTGKPNVKQLQEVPHHLIDIREPNEPYSAAEFCRDAITLIQEIRTRQRIPLLVGGTMLYFRSLLQGLSPLPSADSNIRSRLLVEAETLGWKAMHDRLKVLDPKAASRIHPNDPQRIQRALEIYELSGQSQSALWEVSASSGNFGGLFQTHINNKEDKNHLDFGGSLNIFVVFPKNRALLHERIRQRFHQMLQQGLIEEVQTFYQKVQSGDLHLNLPALRAVGYRQALEYLAGEYTYEEMVNRAIAATRQLAKRQMTWLRSLFKNKDMDRDTETGIDINTDIDTETKKEKRINILDIENNHLDSLKSMVHCLSQRVGEKVNNP